MWPRPGSLAEIERATWTQQVTSPEKRLANAPKLVGTCGGCLSHGMDNTTHSLKMCPLKPSVVLKVLNSSRLLGALQHAAHIARPRSESGQTDPPTRPPRQPRSSSSGASSKRKREGPKPTGATSSASGVPPSTKGGKGTKGKAGKGSKGKAGKRQGKSKGAPSASEAQSSN